MEGDARPGCDVADGGSLEPGDREAGVLGAADRRPSAASSVASSSVRGLRTRTNRWELWAMNSATDVSAMSRPRPITSR